MANAIAINVCVCVHQWNSSNINVCNINIMSNINVIQWLMSNMAINNTMSNIIQ